MSILITTYEGTHNHPLPVSATAMASTTSAAASMLLSGSSTSQPADHNSASFGNAPTLLNGLNFGHFDHSRAKQVFLPNPASPLFPTITLDLTSASSSSSTHVKNCLPSNLALSPRFPLANLSFCSPEPNILPTVWGSGVLNNYKTHVRSGSLGNQFQEQFYQNCVKNQAPSREALADTLTKAISTDPSLRSAIAAAVSSIVGQGSTNVNQMDGGEMLGLGLNLKQGEHSQFASSNPLTYNVKGCLSGYFNRPSSNSHAGNLLLQPPMPFSISKTSVPTSLVDQTNH